MSCRVMFTEPNSTQADRLQADIEEVSELFWVVMFTEPNSTQADRLQADVEEVSCFGESCHVVSCPLNPTLHRLTDCRLTLRR